MAKLKPRKTLQEMQDELGSTFDPSAHLCVDRHLLFSNLEVVPADIYSMTQKEYEELQRMQGLELNVQQIIRDFASLPDSAQATYDGDEVRIKRKAQKSWYGCEVEINYSFGLNLHFLFTIREGTEAMAKLKLPSSPPASSSSTFFKLPREVRDKIYDFALPHGVWKVNGIETTESVTFAGAVGDLSGFHFAFGKSLSILMVNTEMRREALPVAYSKTKIHTEDIDDVIKLLVAIGRIGRESIVSMQFPWESRADLERRWEECKQTGKNLSSALPSLNAFSCVRLLHQCKHLRNVCILFDRDLLHNIPSETFQNDQGIQALCSLKGIKKFEVQDLCYEPLDHDLNAEWLRQKIEERGPSLKQ